MFFPQVKIRSYHQKTWSQDQEENRFYWFSISISEFRFFVSFLLYDFFLSDDFLPSSPVTMFSRVDNFPNKVFGGISADNFGLENFGSIDVSRIRSVSTRNEMKSHMSNIHKRIRFVKLMVHWYQWYDWYQWKSTLFQWFYWWICISLRTKFPSPIAKLKSSYLIFFEHFSECTNGNKCLISRKKMFQQGVNFWYQGRKCFITVADSYLVKNVC